MLYEKKRYFGFKEKSFIVYNYFKKRKITIILKNLIKNNSN